MSDEEVKEFQALMVQSWVNSGMEKEEALKLFKEMYEFE